MTVFGLSGMRNCSGFAGKMTRWKNSCKKGKHGGYSEQPLLMPKSSKHLRHHNDCLFSTTNLLQSGFMHY